MFGPCTSPATSKPCQPQAQTVKQALAALRMLFDWLVIGQIVPTNPAGSVRGPKYSMEGGQGQNKHAHHQRPTIRRGACDD